jgi:hypothetical protein
MAPGTAWRRALSALRASSTSSYRVTSETVVPEGSVFRTRTTKVDAGRQLAETSGSFSTPRHGQKPDQHSLKIVTAGDDAHLQSAKWTGAQAGKWIPVTNAYLAEHEIPFPILSPSTVPSELSRFKPHNVRGINGYTLIDGLIPAKDGFSLLGLSHRQPRNGPASEFGAVAALDVKGCLHWVHVSGEWARLAGASAGAPPPDLDPLVKATTGRITISSVGTPQKIDVPAPGSIVASADL